MALINLTLPYPPSLNTLYRIARSRIYMTTEGKQYLAFVYEIAFLQKAHHIEGKPAISVEIEMYPPDNRRRDVDNICKILLDAFKYAQLYEDDSQIIRLLVNKHPKDDKGKGFVKVAIDTIEMIPLNIIHVKD